MTDIVAVLFDWAGTMIDFGSRAPVLAMQSVFTHTGVAVNDAQVRRFMGMAKREHVSAILAEAEMAARWQAITGALPTQSDIDQLMVALEPAMQTAAAQCSTLIPGAAAAAATLRARGIKIGSTTGYTRTMMADIIPAAAAQGYAPDVIVCAGDTPHGRPAPLMLWQAMATLGAWPVDSCVAVDDAPVGVTAGRNAGVWTVGIAASGNGVGLAHDDWAARSDAEQAQLMRSVVAEFSTHGADFVIPSVADLDQALAAISAARAHGQLPGGSPTALLAGLRA